MANGKVRINDLLYPTEKSTPTPAPASDKRTSASQLSSGVCNDGFLGNLVNCDDIHGVCFKGLGDIFFRHVLNSQDSTKP